MTSDLIRRAEASFYRIEKIRNELKLAGFGEGDGFTNLIFEEFMISFGLVIDDENSSIILHLYKNNRPISIGDCLDELPGKAQEILIYHLDLLIGS